MRERERPDMEETERVREWETDVLGPQRPDFSVDRDINASIATK